MFYVFFCCFGLTEYPGKVDFYLICTVKNNCQHFPIEINSTELDVGGLFNLKYHLAFIKKEKQTLIWQSE